MQEITKTAMPAISPTVAESTTKISIATVVECGYSSHVSHRGRQAHKVSFLQKPSRHSLLQVLLLLSAAESDVIFSVIFSVKGEIKRCIKTLQHISDSLRTKVMYTEHKIHV